MSSIDITGVGIRFGHTEVLHDLDLHVEPGSITAILGSSGSGKSTLLRCIAGLLRPGAGRIMIGSREVFGPGTWVRPERRGVGVVPQEGALFPHLSVADNVGYGLADPDGARRIEQMLALVGLPGTGRMRPHELSGGMQQRVAVARALSGSRRSCCSTSPSPPWTPACGTTSARMSSPPCAAAARPPFW